MIVTCPHCFNSVEILEINCAIFRHAIYKNTFNQIDPHLSKERCDYLIKTEQVYGCGKPFKLIKENETFKAIKCEYI
jgi:hypothetical protein|uniref:Uncharacterized protein n=1 Tax=viral metagenome TaxID=1070528 RepID=A0A6C0CX64_9ZZZZ